MNNSKPVLEKVFLSDGTAVDPKTAAQKIYNGASNENGLRAILSGYAPGPMVVYVYWKQYGRTFQFQSAGGTKLWSCPVSDLVKLVKIKIASISE